MPDPNNPLNALRKASSISANPNAPDPSQISAGAMPLPPWGSVLSGIGQVAGGVEKVAPAVLQGLQRAAPAAETLGEVDPFHTPVGGEGLFNIARAGLRGLTDPVEEAYRAILVRGGK